jgi:hypothetical protein
VDLLRRIQAWSLALFKLEGHVCALYCCPLCHIDAIPKTVTKIRAKSPAKSATESCSCPVMVIVQAGFLSSSTRKLSLVIIAPEAMLRLRAMLSGDPDLRIPFTRSRRTSGQPQLSCFPFEIRLRSTHGSLPYYRRWRTEVRRFASTWPVVTQVLLSSSVTNQMRLAY